MNITKSAPLPERLSEQLTCCEKNGSVQGNYINRVAKRHNCRITGKTKATAEGRQWHNTKLEHIQNTRLLAGGQCYQSGSIRCHACNERIFLEYSLRYFSRTNAHGANLSSSCSFTAFLRCFFLDDDNFFNDLSVIVDTCNPVCHNSSHHGAGDGYSCSLALRRRRRLISPSNAAVTNCPVLSPSSLTLSIASTMWSGTRASILFDFAFTDFVAISDCRLIWCPTMITRKKFNAMLDVSHTIKIICVRHLFFVSHETTKPGSARTLTGLLTTNDRKRIKVAMLNHTTHPQGRDSYNLNKYIWRFIALSTAQPRVIHIVATSEQEARQKNQLIATGITGYDSRAPHKTGAGIGLPLKSKAIQTPLASFFVSAYTHTSTMVGCMGLPSGRLVTLDASKANSVQSTASKIGLFCGGCIPTSKEAANMATIPTLVHSQTAFIWRFIIFGASESQIVHVTAWTEREARNRCPSGCVAVFTARIRQEVRHD